MNAIPTRSPVIPADLAQAWEAICPGDPARSTAAFVNVAVSVLDGLGELEGTTHIERAMARDMLRFVQCFDPSHDRALTLRAMKAVSVYMGQVETHPPRTDLLGPGANWDEERALSAVQALASIQLRGASWPHMAIVGAMGFRW